MFRSSALAFAIVAGFAAASNAGEQFVDCTGFAAADYDVVSYIDRPRSEIGQPQQGPLSGIASITADFNGVRVAFATEANRDRFLTSPAKCAPQYDGHCAYGVAQSGKVPGNPNLWRILDGNLYLNITKNVVGFWEADSPGNLSVPEGNWVALKPQAASDMAIREFASLAPIKN